MLTPNPPQFHVDPKIEEMIEEMTPAESGKLRLRVCCICGVITKVEELDECPTCEGYMCSGHALVKISAWA